MEAFSKKKTLIIVSALVLIVALVFNSILALDDGGLVKKNILLTKQSSGSELGDIAFAHGTTKDANNEFVFSHNGQVYNNEYERLLAEDGFIYGMDWDWFGSWTEGMTSFGKNEITGHATVYREAYVERSLYNMKAMGFNAVSVWTTINGGGITYDSNGLATGLNESFVKNFTAFLQSCRKVGIDFVPTLLVHGYASNYNQASLGLSVQQKYYRYFRYYYEDEARQAYLENVIEPMCEIMADYQDVVAMVDLTVENGTNSVNDPENGMLYTSYFGTTWENVCKLINGLNRSCKKYMPNVPTSVEDVGWENNSFKYNDLDVDIIGRNEYNESGTVADLSTRFITRPSYLGEYNVSEDNNALNSHSEEYFKNARLKFLPSAISNGYIGAFYYNWNNESGGNRCFFKGASCDDYESIRSFVTEMAYQIIDLKNEFRGNENYTYDPALLYNNGSNKSYWIGGKNVNHFKLERKDNGGAWHTIDGNIDFNSSMLENGLICYTDTTLVPEVTYQYRVTAVLNSGAEVVSQPGNEFELFVPDELFNDTQGNYMGGFEQGALTGNKSQENSNGWYDAAWGAKIGNFVTTEHRSGNYSLYANIDENIGTFTNYTAKWAYNLKLTPNTLYELSFYCKNCAGALSVTARPSNSDTNLCYTSIPTTTDNEWHKVTARFTVPTDGKVRIFLMSMESAKTKFYLDDFSVVEAR